MDIDELKALKAKYESALRLNARSAILALFRQVFEDYPTLLTVEWQQYTPYFNDGEPCEFRRWGFYARWEGMSGADDSVADWWLDRSFTDPDHRFPDHLREAERVLDWVPRDIFLAAFGDHAEVFVSRRGIEVEEFASHG